MGVKVVDLSISTSDAHSRANANMSIEEALKLILSAGMTAPEQLDIRAPVDSGHDGT